MGNFPYNREKYTAPTGEYNGSPLGWKYLQGLADTICFWHSNTNTDDWTQSGDGFSENVKDLTYGLMELFSDPSFVRRTIAVGRDVKRSVHTIFESDSKYVGDVRESIAKLFLDED